MFLEKVAALKKVEVQKRKKSSLIKEMKIRIAGLSPPRNLMESITQSAPMALIAEIKRASPSAGIILKNADVPAIAGEYQAGGASAISVLTEGHFFGGDLGHLGEVKEKVKLPLLQKDFIIDPFQIYEGRSAGADAVLLIAAILGGAQIQEFAELAGDLGMTPLVEIHDEDDLRKISSFPLPLIGINNRNLKTLEVNLEATLHLIKKIPQGTLVLSESGIKSREDVERLQEAGVSGILVGEILMRAPDRAAKIRELLNLDHLQIS
ncbi:MAG: indole-3-glycerol phosphate synthase TrpC [Thermodesulfobacteriota bacterium]|nr:indole-3-glycerol phosphate synthase TrpC [Thermodesulfobacteriota bacterium]